MLKERGNERGRTKLTDDKREYDRKWRQKRKREKGGWVTKTYGNMRSRNKRKFGADLDFTKDEFTEWLDDNYHDKFNSLFQKYVDNDCDKSLAPSIDRLDDYSPYSLDNIQLITWRENNEKGRESTKNKKQCGDMAKKVWSKKVAQYTLDGQLVSVFSSVREAERKLGFVDSSTISKVCRGVKHTHKGFVWKYVVEDE